MSEVNNEEIARLLASPYLLYVEGEDDERIIRAWCDQCGAKDAVNKLVFKIMGGGTKVSMQKAANEHYEAICAILPNVKRKVLFDYDTEATAFHPPAGNPVLHGWKRKNIDNYLLVPSAWHKALLKAIGASAPDLLSAVYTNAIDIFFAEQNLTLPPARTWRNVNANIFQIVDGKGLLFESQDSLFHRLKSQDHGSRITRELVATNMSSDEIHDDVHEFMSALNAFVA